MVSTRQLDQRPQQLDHSPDRVLEARVHGARVHVVERPELFQVPQALHLRRVDDTHKQGMQLNVAMDAVTEHLESKVWSLLDSQNSFRLSRAKRTFSFGS